MLSEGHLGIWLFGEVDGRFLVTGDAYATDRWLFYKPYMPLHLLRYRCPLPPYLFGLFQRSVFSRLRQNCVGRSAALRR